MKSGWDRLQTASFSGVRAHPGVEPGETRIGVDPRDRAPFVGLDLCISKGIGYVQGTYLCRVRPLRRRLRSNPYKGSDLYTGQQMT